MSLARFKSANAMCAKDYNNALIIVDSGGGQAFDESTGSSARL